MLTRKLFTSKIDKWEDKWSSLFSFISKLYSYFHWSFSEKKKKKDVMLKKHNIKAEKIG